MEWMRKQGTLVSGKLSSRSASEGLVAIVSSGPSSSSVVELSSETDFACKNEVFHQLLRGVVCSVAASSENGELTSESVGALPFEQEPGKQSGSVKEAVEAAVLSIRENISVRKAAKLSVDDGVVGGYIHNVAKSDVKDVKMGQLGVIVGLAGVPTTEDSVALARKIAMHVAAAAPHYINRSNISEDVLSAQRELLSQEARDSGKPENVIERMVEGRMSKFYQEKCLEDQTYLIYDGEGKAPTVANMLKEEAESLGVDSISVSEFYSFKVGL